MGKITLRQAARWCGGAVEEIYADVAFLGVSKDPQTLEPGQLYLATREDAAALHAAMEKGAAAVLCGGQVEGFPAIVVEEPEKALAMIAREERKRIGPKVVAVTGSVGKSTTKEMVAAVLESTYKVCQSPAECFDDLGVAMTLLAMEEETEVAVLEMGMNRFGQIAQLSDIARPDVAVIVNIGTTHMESVGSREGIRKAKMEITEGMSPNGMLLLNGDDLMLLGLDHRPFQRITYFGQSEGCDVRGYDIRQEGERLRFCVQAGKLSVPVDMLLEGEHFVNDALAAVTVALKLAVPSERISEGLSKFHNAPGRQEIIRAGEYTIIKDCGNTGPESMAAALNVLGNRPGRHVAVLGDMPELGDCTQAEHYKIGRIAAEKAELVFAFGSNADRVINGTITGGMPESSARAFTDKESLIAALKRAAKPGDVILFKGSREMHMELVLEGFLREEKQ